MKIIFICGANRSGSTLIGAILGSDLSGPFKYFHVGEIHSFFRKKSKNYGNPKWTLDTQYGSIWQSINPNVEYSGSYDEIKRVVNDMTFLIDSSKLANNLKIVLDNNLHKKFNFQCVVSYKPFMKIWDSDQRRGKSDQHKMRNVEQYIDIFKIIDSLSIPYIVVNIDSLLINPSLMTKAICKQTGIQYFTGKEYYWNFQHAHLYGSSTQRKHILNPSEGEYKPKRAELDINIDHPFFKRSDIISIENRLLKESISF